MQCELKEIYFSVAIGEVHKLDFELLINRNDTNVQLLIKLMEGINEIFKKNKKFQ